MNNDYKKIFLIFFAVFSLIILASFQIAFLNQFRWGFNIFLVLISLLILTKNIYGAIFLGWFGGFLIDTVSFSTFGVTSLLLLFTTAFLIILQKKALLTLKSENILATGAFAVFFYHFLSWIMNNILTRGQEKFSFHFLDSGIIVEFLLTVVILLIIFSIKGDKIFKFNV
ncbi:MAG: hypothetical protein UT16_C0009G0004 [Candidatus Azambacteria bacterium GW2011_GWA2_39_10]|uniref:Rod shape-determining protein MreD n=1 Tax=Candidatus Azambacteria bacterium GW2011_GWA2_39_10 TaxID=1618611 RepID=A0A0G0P2D3_9BACT|nr:MAG: hypothetical protein UT16_C0009G0004 [Candidatus Azambacteria bacterium GW2011_GWA2_39_10]